MKDTQVVYIGIDVSKDTLDIDAGDIGAAKIANAPAEIRGGLIASSVWRKNCVYSFLAFFSASGRVFAKHRIGFLLIHPKWIS